MYKKFKECVRNLDLRVQVHPGEIWVSKQRVHIVLEASKSAVAKDDVPKICGLVLTHSLGVFKFVCTYFCTRLPLYRGSPTYAVFTTAKPTTAIFGLWKWGIFTLVWDLLQSHFCKFWVTQLFQVLNPHKVGYIICHKKKKRNNKMLIIFLSYLEACFLLLTFFENFNL